MTTTSGSNEPNELQESDPNGGGAHGLAGGMGVSSERVGKVRGSDEPATHGVESTAAEDVIDPPPEQTTDA